MARAIMMPVDFQQMNENDFYLLFEVRKIWLMPDNSTFVPTETERHFALQDLKRRLGIKVPPKENPHD